MMKSVSPKTVVKIREEFAAVSQEDGVREERNFLFEWSLAWLSSSSDAFIKVNRIKCCRPVICLVYRLPVVELKCERKKRRNLLLSARYS